MARVARTHKRFRWAAVLAALAVGVVFAIAGGAFADNLDDTLAAGSVTNPTINEGGSFSTTINYQVQKTGANNTSFPATVNFALSSAPAWVSLNVTSRSFSAYTDVESVTVSGTAPAGSGGAAYNFSVSPSTSASNLNVSPAAVSIYGRHGECARCDGLDCSGDLVLAVAGWEQWLVHDRSCGREGDGDGC